ncbi:signal transduction histidine kinase [Pseudonocardia hierapolitana]|uniref:histidine kinase n=1 Tax=Pseudonocardia hierapolitana TaxID=1128676 RepID=A0A561SPH9_9PSEU|nr:sensor histidine kinase [Pseudonocardia hierapolitana]TWF76769.1 signal transduction histidine kinase [Pseudonocardia hierapolitana]
MRLRATLWVLGTLPVLWAGLTSSPGRLTPAEIAAHVAALGAAVLLTERRPALALAIAVAGWEIVFLGRAEVDSLLGASALAVGLAGVALLSGHSAASGHRDAVVLVLGPAAGAATALLTTGEADTAIGTAVGAAVLSTVPWTVGRYRRLHDELVRTGWDRAARWEREAEYARARERARLAGEMHDLVGHELAKAALQIGALELDPALDAKYRSAAGIARMGVTAAAERLADTVRLLRAEPDDPGTSVSELVERSAAAGLDVTLETGELRPHDPVVAATLTRVVAEALTNAMKHAPDARVLVGVQDAVHGPEVTVDSGPAPSATAPGAGLGLAGLAERVRLLGGTFTAGPTPDGGFRVTAALPRSPAAPAPMTTDVEHRRAQERVRRSGRRVVLAAALVSVGGLAAVLAYMWFDAATSVLDPAGIRPGDPVSEVSSLLPARIRTDGPGDVPPEPPGASCRYYSTHANPFDARGSDLYRLCVRDDRVVGVDLIAR